MRILKKAKAMMGGVFIPLDARLIMMSSYFAQNLRFIVGSSYTFHIVEHWSAMPIPP